MWKIAVCDDEKIVCDDIVRYLERISRNSNEQFSIDVFYSAEQMLSGLSSDTDILLLDIKMNDMTGMEAARKLRKKNARLCIIFITTMTEYALEGYEVHAFGFIKKPVNYPALERYITESIERLSSQKNDMVTVNDASGIRTISSFQIIYIEAYHHEITIVTEKEKLITTSSLSELEEKLTPKGFYRVHKSFIVNMRHIKSIESNELIMSDGSKVFLSKHRKKEFMEGFIRYSGGII